MRKKTPKFTNWRSRMVLSNRVRRSIVFLLLFGLALLIVSQQNRQEPLGKNRTESPPVHQDRRLYDGQWATVVRVVDGDTLDIDIADAEHPTTRIRLWGVDTPEIKHSKWGQMYFGPEASQFAKKLALGKKVKVALEPFEKARDKYGRLLAYVFLPDGSMLNEQLLTHGMAYADERFDHIYRRRFLQHQKQAQKNKLGLWKNVQPTQWPHWYRRRHDPDYQKGAKKNGKPIRLDPFSTSPGGRRRYYGLTFLRDHTRMMQKNNTNCYQKGAKRSD